jgi:hypothetical protein
MAFVSDVEHHDAADDPRASYSPHPVDEIEPLPDSKAGEWGLALSLLFGWLTEPYFRNVPQRGGGRKVICCVSVKKLGLRTAALIYSLRPDLLPGETASSLADKCGVTKQAFAKHVRSFRDRFKLKTRTMRSDDAREAMRRAAIASHARRGSKQL